eukprot:2156373-Pyramimonas_sp.AAC.1
MRCKPCGVTSIVNAERCKLRDVPYAMGVMWRKPWCAGYVVSAAWCKLWGASCAVQATWRSICDASCVVHAMRNRLSCKL